MALTVRSNGHAYFKNVFMLAANISAHAHLHSAELHNMLVPYKSIHDISLPENRAGPVCQ